MTRTVVLQLSRMDVRSQGSVAYVNRKVMSAFEGRGWNMRPLSPTRPAASQEAVLPLALAGACAADAGFAPADVAVCDDAGLLMRTPDRRWAKKTVVLYHGLAYGAGTWMANPGIDLHCANSPYLARVLQSILAFPDWRSRRCLDERAFDAVTDIALPVPGLADADDRGSFAEGAELPAPLLRLIEAGAVLGHSVQPGKQDIMAATSILYWLNAMARERGTAPVRLVISAASLEPAVRQRIDAMLAPAGFRCDDFFIAVPHLRQSALHRLMRGSRFCLAYNRFPEPFGFYVLESILNACPVYTNGVGNNRHLLPEEHGIVVEESIGMAGEVVDAGAYRPVARRILDDLSRADDMRRCCDTGAARVRAQWSNDAFARGVDDLLERLERAAAPAAAFDDLVVSLSPLVRQFDPSSGRCLNDYGNTLLTAHELEAVEATLGKPCADLDGAWMLALEEQSGLFRRGILTLAPRTSTPEPTGAARP